SHMTSNIFFNVPQTTEINTLSLHDALPISKELQESQRHAGQDLRRYQPADATRECDRGQRGLHLHCDPSRHPAGESDSGGGESRSEEHTSELQSRGHLVCRLLLEKKKRCEA